MFAWFRCCRFSTSKTTTKRHLQNKTCVYFFTTKINKLFDKTLLHVELWCLKIYFCVMKWSQEKSSPKTFSLLCVHRLQYFRETPRRHRRKTSVIICMSFGEGEFRLATNYQHTEIPPDILDKYFMQYEKIFSRRKKIVEFLYIVLTWWKYVYFLCERGGLTSLCLFIGFHKPER